MQSISGTGPVVAWWRRGAGFALVLAMVAFQGSVMAKMVIFSAVRGQVLQHGKPVAGAVIERTFKWAWKDETGTDSVSTGADGEFFMPPIERRSWLGSLLPHEPEIRQKIVIRHGGKTYPAWTLFKYDYANQSELGGRPINITCRLEAQALRRGELFGICEPQ